MQDPRFREAVILVTQTSDGHTVGVILNRPLKVSLAELIQDPRAREHTGPIGYGGPVMERAVVALFRSEAPPAAPAFHVLRGIYLSMHPRAIEPLLATGGSGHRFFAGFSGWAPRQLQAEVRAEAWLIVPASEALVFRTDTQRMWTELVEKARGFRTRAMRDPHAILVP